MKAVAIALALSACMPPPPAPTDPVSKLLVRREQQRSRRTMSIIGLAVGVAATVGGVLLLDHAAELRASEATADSEGGLGELLGGTLLTTSGIVCAGASGIALGLSTHELSKIDSELDAELRRQATGAR